MRVLVTGGCGFIGSTLIHHILHACGVAPSGDCCPDEAAYGPNGGPEDIRLLNLDALTYAANPANLDGVADHPAYRFLRADIADAAAVDAAFASFEPDAVVHLAAESHVDRSIDSALAFARTNVVGTQVLLEAARRHDVDRFVHVSTDEVYGSRLSGSFTERDPLNPANPYAASKAGADLLVLAHARTYGLKPVITRSTNNYGPRQHAEKFVPTVLRSALEGRPVPLYGDGAQVRDWLYVRDHCAALLHLLRSRPPDAIYNVAGRAERANVELARALLAAAGTPDHPLAHVRDRPGHDVRYSIDDSHLRSLGWRPRVSLEDGIARTARWYQQRLTLARGIA